MCGIVGYIGSKDAYPILLEGLSVLEYRGYDSAGIALVNGQGMKVYKDKGKVDNLRTITSDIEKKGIGTGIAHTRWATHGVPSKHNSHPHTDQRGRIALVHNGIIENYSVLKEKLVKEGIKFSSETDTEVLAQLIGKYYEKDLAAAVRRALLDVDGTYGIAVVASDQPGLLIGARRGSPLVAGVGEGEMFLASDAAAIVAHTKNVIYLKDNHLIELTRDGFETTTLDNKKINSEIHTIEWSVDALAKGGFDHFMLKEIFEQPETIYNAMRGRLLVDEGVARLDGLNLVLPELRGIQRILFVACGTSWHAALVGEYMIEEVAGIPVEVEYASEFRYRNPIIEPNTLIFVISQSGETADTLAALREATYKGATVLGAGNRCGVNQGFYLATHGAGTAYPAAWQDAKDFQQ
jgi:glucosamine--fructose-6-phosphate aminotransferase (isomerizing)